MKVLRIKTFLLQVVSCTTDNAANFAKSFREFGETSTPDAVPAHQQDLVVLNLDSDTDTTDNEDEDDDESVDVFNEHD